MITALLDTTSKSNYWYAIPWLMVGLTTPKQLLKGLWLTLVQRIKTPFITGVSGIEVLGEECVTGVSYTVAGKVYYIDCNLIMLHLGLIPETQMGQLLGCTQAWSETQQCRRHEWLLLARHLFLAGRLQEMRALLEAPMWHNLAYLVAQAQQRPVEEVEPFTVSPPLSPINLGQLSRQTEL